MGFFVVPDDEPAAVSEAGRSDTIPLGRGIEGVRLLVLTGAGEVAGVGEIGEIHVQTSHLALGYLDDEALTRERFVS